MSFTAREAIAGAFRLIGQETKFKTASNDDYNLALPSLNTMLSIWYKLGLRSATNTNTLALDDALPYGDYTRDAIEYSLCERIWSKFAYNVALPMGIVTEADSYRNELWSIDGPSVKSVFPGTLPIGSGNEDFDTVTTFYPDCEENIYANCDSNQITTATNFPLLGVDNE